MGRGQAAPSHQLGGLGSAVSSPKRFPAFYRRQMAFPGMSRGFNALRSHCIIFHSREKFFPTFRLGVEPVNLPLKYGPVPNRFASRLPSTRATKRSASRLWFLSSAHHSPASPAERGRQTHFGAFQFKISAFCVATHSLFGSRSPNHHSSFGGDKFVGIPISPNLGETCN